MKHVGDKADTVRLFALDTYSEHCAFAGANGVKTPYEPDASVWISLGESARS